MSSFVHFWSFPIPHTLEEASSIFAGLPRTGRPQNRSFIELARQLTARHPCLTTLPDADDPRAVWTDSPLDGLCGSASYAVGIRPERRDEVLPFVIETATALGLVTYDEQAEAVHLPGGSTLLAGKIRRVGDHLGVPLSGPLSAALVERTLLDAFFPVLASEGFELNRAAGGLFRSHAHGTQTLRLRVYEQSPTRVAFDVETLLVDNSLRQVVDHILLAGTQGREKYQAIAIGSMAVASRFFRQDAVPVVTQDDGSLRIVVESLDALRRAAVALRWLVADELRSRLNDWRDRDQIAMALHNPGHGAVRSIGNLVRQDAGGLTSTLLGGRLLDTRRCGGPAIGLLLAAMARAPMLREIVDRAYAEVAELPRPQLAVEKAKLDACMSMLRESNLIT